jgi:hypothetical protein
VGEPLPRGLELQRIALILLVLGLLLGPAYYAFCERLSGEEIGRYDLGGPASRWTVPDGTIQRFSGHGAFQPLLLDLNPERNDFRVTATFHAAPGATAGTNRYLATLALADYPVFQREIDVALEPGTSRSIVVANFPVHRQGTHLLTIEEAGTAATAVPQVTVTVLQNVKPLVRPLAWSGFAMLLLGSILLAWWAWTVPRASAAGAA